MSNKKRELYNLVSTIYDTSDMTFEQFEANLNDEKKRQALFRNLSGAGFQDYDSFNTALGYGSVPKPAETPVQAPVQALEPSVGSIRDTVPQLQQVDFETGYEKAERERREKAEREQKYREEQLAKAEQYREKAGKIAEQKEKIDDAANKRAKENLESNLDELKDAPFWKRFFLQNYYFNGDPSSPNMGRRSLINNAGTDKDLDKLVHASNMLRSTKNTLTEAATNLEEGDGNGFDAGRGIWDQMPDVFKQGEELSNDAIGLYTTIQKQERGEQLTEAEDALLDAYATQYMTNQLTHEDISSWYRAGQSTAESIPFMIEMMINPLSQLGDKGAKAGMKVADKQIMKKYGEKALINHRNLQRLGKGIGRVTGDILGATGMALTTGAFNVTADAATRMAGTPLYTINDDGSVNYNGSEGGEDLLPAVGKAVASTAIENYSEMFGNYLDALNPLTKKIGKKLYKMSPSGVKKFADKISSSEILNYIGKIEKQAQWHGVFGEYAEEVAGGIMNSLIVGDNSLNPDDPNYLFDKEQQLETFMSVALMGGFFSGIRTVAYPAGEIYQARQAKNNVGKRSADASLVFGAENWNEQRAEIDAEMRRIVEAGEDPNKSVDLAAKLVFMSEEERKATMEYINAWMNYEGRKIAKAKTKEELNARVEDIAEQEAYDAGEEIIEDSEKDQARMAYEIMQQRVFDEFGKDELTHDDALAIYDSADFTEQQKQLALDYRTARAKYDGMMDKVRDDIETEVYAAHREIDYKTHKQSGNVITLETKDRGKEVNLISGELEYDEEGNVINAKSDGTLIVRDADGTMSMIPASHIAKRVGEVSAQQLKDETEATITEDIASREAARIDGLLTFTPGEITMVDVIDANGIETQVAVLMDNGDGSALVQSTDGTVSVPIAELQAGNERFKAKQLAQMYAARDNARLQAQEDAANEAREARTLQGYQEGASFGIKSDLGNTIATVLPSETDGMVTIEEYNHYTGARRTRNVSVAQLDQMRRQYEAIPESEADFRGNRLPLNEDGTVDEDTLIKNDVEAWAAYNDKQVDQEDTRQFLEGEKLRTQQASAKKVQQLEKDREKAVEAYRNAETPSQRTPLRQRIAEIDKQINEERERTNEYADKIQALIDARTTQPAPATPVTTTAPVVEQTETPAETPVTPVVETQPVVEAQPVAPAKPAKKTEVPDMSRDKASDARARGYRLSGGQRIDRPAPITNKIEGAETEVKFSTNSKHNRKGRYVVVESNDMQASHRNGQANPLFFINEAQPKDRTDGVSAGAARVIANNMNPQQIIEGVTAYQGAPVINARGEVIQGNNRTAALQEMHASVPERAAEYKQYLIDHASQYGLDADAIAQMKSPVLVRMIDVTDNDAINLGQKTNSDMESGGSQRMNPASIWKSLDADKKEAYVRELLKSTEDAEEEDESLRDTVRRNGYDALRLLSQAGVINATQRQTAMNADGTLTPTAIEDLIGILQVDLFEGGIDALPKMFNNLPAKIQKGLMATMYRDLKTPEAAKMKEHIQEVIEILDSALRDPYIKKAKTRDDIVKYFDLWGDQGQWNESGEVYTNYEKYSRFAVELAMFLKEYTQRYITSAFNQYYDSVQGVANIFGEGKPTPMMEAIKEAFNIDYNEQQEQQQDSGAGNEPSVDEHDESSGSRDSEGSPGLAEDTEAVPSTEGEEHEGNSGAQTEDEAVSESLFSRESEETSPAPAVEQAQTTEPKSQPKTTTKQGSSKKIDDFGEKIAGARKDALRDIAATLEHATEQNFAAQTLSKVFKTPNIKKMMEEGLITEQEAYFIKALSDLILSRPKPRAKKSRLADPVANWARQQAALANMLREFVSNDASRQAILDGFANNKYLNQEGEKKQRMDRWRVDGGLYTPSPIYVAIELAKRIGADWGKKLSIPVIETDSQGRDYRISTSSSNTLNTAHSLEEALEIAEYMCKLDSGIETDHPASSFDVSYESYDRKPTGKFIIYDKNMSEVGKFDSKEEAEAKRDELVSKSKSRYPAFYVHEEVANTKERYRISFRHIITGERIKTEKTFDTREEAEAYVRENTVELSDIINTELSERITEKDGPLKLFASYDRNAGKVKYELWVTNGSFLIDQLGTYDSRKAAQEALEKYEKLIQAKVEEQKKANKDFSFFGNNSERKGKDHRGGKDATPEMFTRKFGFRGVQFGNWTNERDRQNALNQAYDAFCDMAELLGVSTQALSLNGELGLAFGARGGGNAAAHYEPAEVVINLTKTKGAGSLAHEWWHALDNYLARRGGTSLGMVTAGATNGLRPEVARAFKGITDAITKSEYSERSKRMGSYWGSMVEMTARLFERAMYEKMTANGISNSFLVGNFKNEKAFMDRKYENYCALCEIMGNTPKTKEEYFQTKGATNGFPYPLDAELSDLGEKVTNLFDTLDETTSEDGKVVLFSRETGTRTSETDELNEEELAPMVMELIREARLREAIAQEGIRMRRRAANRINEVAKRIGVRVKIHTSTATIRNQRARKNIESDVMIRGWYETGSKEVHIYLPNISSIGAGVAVLIHEAVAHKGIRSLFNGNVAEFNKLCRQVWSEMSDADKRKMIAYVLNRDSITEAEYQRAIQNEKNILAAADEHMAHIAEKKTIRELNKAEQSIWRRMMNAIRNLLKKLNINIEVKEIDDVIVSAYSKMIKEAKERESKRVSGEVADLMEGEAGVVFADNGELIAQTDPDTGQTRFNVLTWEKGGRQSLVNFMETQIEAGKLTREECENWLDSMDGLTTMAKEYAEGHPESLFGQWSVEEVRMKDGEDVPLMRALKSNADYDLNIDFSTVCKKRQVLNEIFNTMIKKGVLLRENLSSADIASINQIIQKHGLEIACAICFVDAKRYNAYKFANKFLAKFNPMLQSLAPGENLAGFNYAEDERFTNEGKRDLTQETEVVDWLEVIKCKNDAEAKKYLKANYKLDWSKVYDTLAPAIAKMRKKYNDKKWLSGTLEKIEKRKLKNEANERLNKIDGGSRKMLAVPNLLDELVTSSGHTSTVEKRAAWSLSVNPSLRKLAKAEDFIASTGWENVMAQNSNLTTLWNQQKGAAGARPNESNVQYLSDVLEKNVTQDIFDIAGYRMQSFSDFIGRMYFDYLQAFADLSAKQLPGHAYTKEPPFVKIFGLMGMKINMSLVAKVDKSLGKDYAGLTRDKDGNLVYNWDVTIRDAEGNITKQGQTFPPEEAFALQSNPTYSKNAGTIAVGLSREHILMMLRDPNIRMVIPYHKSGLPHIVRLIYNMLEVNDYEKVQNTTWHGELTDDQVKKLKKRTDNYNFCLHQMSIAENRTTAYDALRHVLLNYDVSADKFDMHEAYRQAYADIESGKITEGLTGREISDRFDSENFIAKAAADIYLEVVESLGGIPKFKEFSKEQGYYKTLIDFAVYDHNGNYTPQEVIKFKTPDNVAELIQETLSEDEAITAKQRAEMDPITDEIIEYLGNTELRKAQDAIDNKKTDNVTREDEAFAGQSLDERTATVYNVGDSRTGKPAESETRWSYVPQVEINESLAHRTYRENGSFSFTGANQITSSSDVAYIFRELENHATENSFIVFVKDNVPTILHTGIGSITSTAIDMTAIIAGYNDFNPDTIYMVHNHPSGNLVASNADIQILKNIKEMVDKKVRVEGIIIDTVSGKYGVFDDMVQAREEMPESGEDIPIKVMSFDKMVFDENYKRELSGRTLTGSKDVAAFLSSHRLGDNNKLGALLLNNRLVVNANLVTNVTDITGANTYKKVVAQILDAGVRAGANRIVLFGNYDFSTEIIAKLSTEIKAKSGGEMSLVDVVQKDIDGNYLSIADGTLGRGRSNGVLREADANEQIANDKVSEEGLQESETRFSLRTKPAPKETRDVWKLMRLGADGLLYPLYIDRNSPGLQLNVWYDADAPKIKDLLNLEAGYSYLIDSEGNVVDKIAGLEGRATSIKGTKPSIEQIHEASANGMRWIAVTYYASGKKCFSNIGISGSTKKKNYEGSVSAFAMRPGWHAGSLPSMKQIGARSDDMVWVKGKVAYGNGAVEEAAANGGEINDHIPVDGGYMKATSSFNEETVDWYISGAFMPLEIVSDVDAMKAIDDYNAENKTNVPYDVAREGGKLFNAKTRSFDMPETETRFSIANNEQTHELNRKQKMSSTPAVEIEHDTLFSISKNNKKTIQGWLSKRQDLTEAEKDSVLDYIGNVEAEGVNNTTMQLAMGKWFATGVIRLPEDYDKVLQAVRVAEAKKANVLQFKNPMEVIETLGDIEVKEKPINPDDVPTLHLAKRFDNGIAIYDVDESQESRENMRKIINTHFGKEASPWCLLQGDGNGNLTEKSKRYWKHYNAYPKQVAFKNGKLIAFSANDYRAKVWWDRMDESHGGIPVVGKIPGDKLGRSGTIRYNPTNGEQQSIIDIHKGNREKGHYQEWADNGQLILDRTYTEEGLLDGQYREWHPNGNKKEEAFYVNGKQDGVSRSWYDNGQIHTETHYHRGEYNGEITTWYKSGQIRSQVYYQHGMGEGLARTWAENGQLQNESFNKKDRLEGRRRKWNTDGQLIEESNYTEGFLDGVQRLWKHELPTYEEITYKHGAKDGKSYEWIAGKLAFEENYKQGKRDGLNIVWDSHGKAKQVTNYSLGVEIPLPSDLDISKLKPSKGNLTEGETRFSRVSIKEELELNEKNHIPELEDADYPAFQTTRFSATFAPNTATFFSGGGLVEAALASLINPKMAVEYDSKIAGVYKDNHGDHIVNDDVRNVSVNDMKDMDIQYFHASPVCKNFSSAKIGGQEMPIDITTARATARVIDEITPNVVTIENVPRYINSQAMQIILNALKRKGYTYDTNVYNNADFGGATSRRRLIVRAVRNGSLPNRPAHVADAQGWYSRVQDLMPSLEERTIPRWMQERIDADNRIDLNNLTEPLYILGGGKDGGLRYAYASRPLPTITTRGDDVIIMPDGRVLSPSPRVLARITGLPDSYKLPPQKTLAHTIIGNGVPSEMVKGVIAPLLKQSESQEGETRFSRANKNQSMFVSNASVAVNALNMGKASGEQWTKAIQGKGGIKAGEDKWLGLTDWLRSQQKPVTKQEVLDYIAKNQIRIEEVKYGKNEGENPIHRTRLYYTTFNLGNKREIALVVPSIDSYHLANKYSDDVHFGDAGDGRAIAWIRFGDTTDNEGNRVLVIDEIQSVRHQDGRKKGYAVKEKPVDIEKLRADWDEAYTQFSDYAFFLMDEHPEIQSPEDWSTMLTKEEKAKIDELERISNELGYAYDAAMKGKPIQKVSNNLVPDAPFDKNWHELAMKRMLRLAAEEGYDKVAWVGGTQQAERYGLATSVASIKVENISKKDREIWVTDIHGDSHMILIDANGIVKRTDDWNEGFAPGGASLSELVGRELANRLMNANEGEVVDTEELKSIGGEGMRGFYDKMLPSFMNKYGKKWGVKVEESDILDHPMHSVDVTPEMRESVMQGQTMFSRVAPEKEDEALRYDTEFYRDLVKELMGKEGFGIVTRSHYETGVDANGKPYTIRISDHPIRERNLDENGEEENRVLSIIVDSLHSDTDWDRRGHSRFTNEGKEYYQFIIQPYLEGEEFRQGLMDWIKNEVEYFKKGFDPEVSETRFSYGRGIRRIHNTDEKAIAKAAGKLAMHMGRGMQAEYAGTNAPKVRYDGNNAIINLDAIANLGDAEKAIMLADVGERGLAALVGDNHYDEFMMKCYEHLDEAHRKFIADMAIQFHGGDFIKAMEKWLAGYIDRDYLERAPYLEKVRASLHTAMVKNGVKPEVDFSPNDLLYLLWRNNNRDGSLVTEADDIAYQSTLHVLNHDDGGSNSPASTGIASRLYNDKVRVTNRNGEKTNTANLLHRLREAYQDRMISLRELQKAILRETGGQMHSYEDAYTAENALSSKNQAEATEYHTNFYQPMLDEISNLMDEGATYEEIITYMYAKHGLERNDYYNNKTGDSRDWSGLTSLAEGEDYTAHAQQIVSDFESKHNVNTLWNRVNAATRATLRKAYECGEMSLQVYTDILSMFNFYIPLRGWEEQTAGQEYEYLSTSNSPLNPVLKTVGGRLSLADDPIATIGNMAESAISQGNRNMMKQKFLTFVENNPTDLVTVGEQWYVFDNTTGKWRRESPTLNPDMTADEVSDAITNFEKRMASLEGQGLATKERAGLDLGMPVKDAEGKEHQVRVKRAGKEYILYLNGNPRAAQALNGMTNADVNPSKLRDLAQAVKNFMARMFTTQNPAFIISNMARDVIWAGTSVGVKENGEYAKRYHGNIMAAFATARIPRLVYKFNHGILDMSDPMERHFYEFVKNGGETGFTQINTVDKFKKNINKYIKEARRHGAAKALHLPADAWNAIWDCVEFLNRSAEDTTRFMVYLTSRQMGRDIQRSISDAKEITVNFNRKGSGGYLASYMNFAYIFFNAAIQSLANAGRLVKHHPIKTLTAFTSFAAAGMLVPLLSEMVSNLEPEGDDDDEEGDDENKVSYWDLPEWVRRSNITMKIPYVNAYLTIPLPHELRAFYGIGEIALSVLKGKTSAEDGIKQAAEGFTNMIPMDFTGNGGNPVINFTPTIAQPFVQIEYNTDFFGSPIYKKNDYNKLDPEFTKAYRGTSPVLVDATRKISEMTGGDGVKRGAVELNPAIIEHLLESYLGGVGKTFNKASKSVSMIWDEDLRQIRNVPVVSSFIQGADERTKGSGLNQQYYKFMDEYRETEHLLNGYKKKLRQGEDYESQLDDFLESERFDRYSRAKGYVNAISKLNTAAKNLSGDDRKEVEMQMNEMKQMLLDELANE